MFAVPVFLSIYEETIPMPPNETRCCDVVLCSAKHCSHYLLNHCKFLPDLLRADNNDNDLLYKHLSLSPPYPQCPFQCAVSIPLVLLLYFISFRVLY